MNMGLCPVGVPGYSSTNYTVTRHKFGREKRVNRPLGGYVGESQQGEVGQ